MRKKITGKVWVVGDDVDTDLIYPGKYLPILEPKEMASHALEGLEPEFPQRLKTGDIIIAGRGFGCGSSREQAATSLKYAGVSAVIAVSFARIFFRNAVNQGLPIVQADLGQLVQDGDIVTVDYDAGVVVHPCGETKFPPLDDSVMGILEAGGLIQSVRKKLGFVV